MKRMITLLMLLLFLLPGCGEQEAPAVVAATTLPVYEFTARICQGTDITVTRLVTESVSCLHDYSLNVRQVKAVESAGVIVISGAGLEDFMGDLLSDRSVIDASSGVDILECEHLHDHDHDHGHHHDVDNHIWLSPDNAMVMARNIYDGLCRRFPQHCPVFAQNLEGLLSDLEALKAYGNQALADLRCRELITFHDGFAYFAHAFDLSILEAVEEESGSEASAQELKYLIQLTRDHNLPAIFTETNGSHSAARVIARETGVKICTLDMAMSGSGYFDAMYHNIDTIKEALG